MSTLTPLQQWYLDKDEPTRICLQYLRDHILRFDPNFKEEWKYGAPFFYYNNKMCCFFWMHKKFMQPYISVVEGNVIKHPALLKEKRARMRIFLIDPNRDLPMQDINDILHQMVNFYKQKKSSR